MIKINKIRARNLFNKGNTIYLLPCKVRVLNSWISPAAIKKENGSFDSLVAAFNYYNCQYRETGLYPSFYVENIKNGD